VGEVREIERPLGDVLADYLSKLSSTLIVDHTVYY
jgi:hypothetical protein